MERLQAALMSPMDSPVQLEYLRNVVYQYMLGTSDAKTLAKVISALVRFTPEQEKEVLDQEEVKQAHVSILWKRIFWFLLPTWPSRLPTGNAKHSGPRKVTSLKQKWIRLWSYVDVNFEFNLFFLAAFGLCDTDHSCKYNVGRWPSAKLTLFLGNLTCNYIFLSN